MHSAKKKLRVDRKKRALNKVVKSKATRLLDKARKDKGVETLKAAFSAIDRAAKKRIFHPKKADRLKSRLAKLLRRLP